MPMDDDKYLDILCIGNAIVDIIKEVPSLPAFSLQLHLTKR